MWLVSYADRELPNDPVCIYVNILRKFGHRRSKTTFKTFEISWLAYNYNTWFPSFLSLFLPQKKSVLMYTPLTLALPKQYLNYSKTYWKYFTKWKLINHDCIWLVKVPNLQRHKALTLLHTKTRECETKYVFLWYLYKWCSQFWILFTNWENTHR